MRLIYVLFLTYFTGCGPVGDSESSESSEVDDVASFERTVAVDDPSLTYIESIVSSWLAGSPQFLPDDFGGDLEVSALLQVLDAGAEVSDIKSVRLTSFQVFGSNSTDLTSVYQTYSIYAGDGDEAALIGQVPDSVLDDVNVREFDLEVTEFEIVDLLLSPGGLRLFIDSIYDIEARIGGGGSSVRAVLRVGYVPGS